MKETTQQLLAGGPLVVGTVHSPGSLSLAATLNPGDVDVLEFRIDSLLEQLDAAEQAMRATRFPVILTVRHSFEGGAGDLSADQRKELYRRFLPHATFVDIELRSLPEFSDLVEEAREMGCAVVISSHDFNKTPSIGTITARQKRAFATGADIFKFACATPTAHDLARLLDFSQRRSHAHSIMGMGRFGKASRIALAEAGSCLNYGYLDAPNAPGQWEARELRRAISGT